MLATCFLEKLATNTTYADFELIIVDDGSTDRSVAVLERWRASGRFERFTLLRKPGTGIVDTLNLALEHAAGEIIECKQRRDARNAKVARARRTRTRPRMEGRVGWLSRGRTVFEDGRVHSYGLNLVGPEGVHDRGTRITEPVGARTLDLHVERPLDAESTLGDVPAEVDSAGGCIMLFSRELAREIGGFDTGYSPVWVEDYDFALGARRLGRKVFYLPDVRVVHRVSLRNPRHAASRRELALVRLRRRIGHLVPAPLRARAAAAAKLGHHDPGATSRNICSATYARTGSMRRGAADPLNPDMDRLLDRYGGTEVAWAYDQERRRAGEEIIGRASRSPSPPSAA